MQTQCLFIQGAWASADFGIAVSHRTNPLWIPRDNYIFNFIKPHRSGLQSCLGSRCLSQGLRFSLRCGIVEPAPLLGTSPGAFLVLVWVLRSHRVTVKVTLGWLVERIPAPPILPLTSRSWRRYSLGSPETAGSRPGEDAHGHAGVRG